MALLPPQLQSYPSNCLGKQSRAWKITDSSSTRTSLSFGMWKDRQVRYSSPGALSPQPSTAALPVVWLATNKAVSPVSGSAKETYLIFKTTVDRNEWRLYFRIRLLCLWALQLKSFTHLSLKFLFPKFLRRTIQSKWGKTGKAILLPSFPTVKRWESYQECDW